MSDFICKKCGSKNYKVFEKSNGTGIATGLYCADCGAWQKWLNKQEKAIYTATLTDEWRAMLKTHCKITEEVRHRAEVVERALDNIMGAFHELLSAIFPDKKIDLDEWKKDILANAEQQLAKEE